MKRTAVPILGQSQTARSVLEREHEPVRSLYIHVPFCFHKCHYCDFYSVVGDESRHEQFVRALLRELEALAPHAGVLDTIFIGGGTPTILSVEQWERILLLLYRHYRLRDGCEFTVECNPETATPELMATLAQSGVNRLSVGAQSFDPRHLKTLERWHEPANVQRALALAAEAGIERRSVDLIFGIPGQTMDEWLDDLARACDLSPSIGHISCYALTVEMDTALAERIRLGDMAPPDEDLQARMYEATVVFLRERGFSRYEVSNFAKSGLGGGPSEHNLAYWRQRSWLAAGPGAAAHVRGGGSSWRFRNVPHLRHWGEGASDGGFVPVTDVEPPDGQRLAREVLMTGVRLAEGVDLDGPDLAELDGAARWAIAREAERLVLIGEATLVGSRLCLTNIGFLHADSIAADLMACVGAGD